MHINFLPNYLLFKNIEKGYNTGGGGGGGLYKFLSFHQ